MSLLTLAAFAPWMTATGIVVFLAICVTLILIVLIQRPSGGGLGGAFGGGAAGSGQTAFGARTGDVLTWATITIFVIFLTLGALLNFVVLPPQAPTETQLVAPAGQTDDSAAPSTTPQSTPPAAQTPPPTETETTTGEEAPATTPETTPEESPVEPPANSEETPGESGGSL